MTEPKKGVYKIIGAAKPAASGSIKLSLKMGEDPIVLAYANPKYLSKHPLETGTEGYAEFENRPSNSGKANDPGFISLKLWTAVGGVQPHPSPIGANPLPVGYRAPEIDKPPIRERLDTRDSSIISQVAAKCTTDLVVAGKIELNDFEKSANIIYDAILSNL